MRNGESTRREFLAGAMGVALLPGIGAAASCAPTEENPEGPFYLPGAPFRVRLAEAEEPGRRLAVTGRVLALPGCAPAPGAVLDVWHASDAGFYYTLEGAGTPEDFQLRGRVRAGADGGYRFETVLPGRYRVTRRWTRPRHIHVRVEHPGYRPLVTQLYFPGDPHLDRDPLVRPGLLVALTGSDTMEAGTGPVDAAFDFVLGPP